MGPPCQGAAQVLQGLACAVRGSVSHDYREGTTPPGQSYLEAETLDPEHASLSRRSQGGLTLSSSRSRLSPELHVCTPVLPVLLEVQTLLGRAISHVHSIVITINPYDLQTTWLSEPGTALMPSTKDLGVL